MLTCPARRQTLRIPLGWWGGLTSRARRSVRSKNVQSLLFKNLIDCCSGAAAFYLFGYVSDSAFSVVTVVEACCVCDAVNLAIFLLAQLPFCMLDHHLCSSLLRCPTSSVTSWSAPWRAALREGLRLLTLWISSQSLSCWLLT